MSNNIEVFNNTQFGSVRAFADENGEPWFVAADVAKVIDVQNIRRNLESLDDDEKGVYNLYTLGGNQNLTTVNESGLYALIIRSHKPEAKAFRKWITSEVIPSIRKTGSYSITKTNMDIAIYSDDPLERGKAIVAMLEEERAKQALIEARADKAEEDKAIAEKKAEDLTEAFSRSIVSDNDKLYSTFIKELKMTTPCASSILKELKIFGKNGHLSDYGDWFKVKVSDNGFPARFVTPIGQMMLVNLFNANREKMRAIGGTYRYIKPSDRCQIIKLPEDVCKNF